jgi:CBS domain-containing protein
MRPAVTTVARHAHLASAAYLMRKAGDSAVVVTTDDGRRPIAVITEADITDAVAEARDVNDVRIEPLIGPDPVTVQSHTPSRTPRNHALGASTICQWSTTTH